MSSVYDRYLQLARRIRRRRIVRWFALRLELLVLLVMGALMAEVTVRLAALGIWPSVGVAAVLLLGLIFVALRVLAELTPWPPRIGL